MDNEKIKEEKYTHTKNKIIIIIPLILIALVIVFIIIFMLNTKKEDNSNQKENTTTSQSISEETTVNTTTTQKIIITDDDNNYTKEGTYTLYYSSNGEPKYFYFSDEKENDEVITTYECKDENCETDVYQTDAAEYAVAYDGGELYYYQINKDTTFNNAKVVSTYNDKDTKIKINTYSLNSEKYNVAILKDEVVLEWDKDSYYFDNPSIGNYEIILRDSKAVIYSSKNIKIIDINAKKEVYRKNIKINMNADNDYNVYFETSEDGLNHLKINNGDGSDEYLEALLTSNFEEICYTKDYLIYTLDDKVYYGKDNKYYIYDMETKKTQESKQYTEILYVAKNYIAIKTEDNKFELIDVDTAEVLVDFGKWEEDYTLEPYYSGLYSELSEYDNIIEDAYYNEFRDDLESDAVLLAVSLGEDKKGYVFYYGVDSEKNGKISIEFRD